MVNMLLISFLNVARKKSASLCKHKGITGELFSLGLQGDLWNHADRQMKTILKLCLPLPCESYNEDSCSPDQRAG